MNYAKESKCGTTSPTGSAKVPKNPKKPVDNFRDGIYIDHDDKAFFYTNLTIKTGASLQQFVHDLMVLKNRFSILS